MSTSLLRAIDRVADDAVDLLPRPLPAVSLPNRGEGLPAASLSNEGEGVLPTMRAADRADSWVAALVDYIELTKPKISILVLVTVAVSMFVGNWGPPAPWLLFHTLLGTALVAASASALNQRLERRTDALMDRTHARPLPTGRLTERDALAFGAATIVVGLAYLALAVNWFTAALGAATWILYVIIYTPLKRVTPLNTVVGAVAGALPTLMGWGAVGGPFTLGIGGGLKAATLFLVVYLWQFPHFMAIAWIYRRQYAAAGLKMLTVVDPSGCRAGAQALMAALALLPVSLVPVVEHAGFVYFAAAVALGIMYLGFSVRFCFRRDESSARWLLRASLVYLPALLSMFMLVPLV
jgi:protoheme IX farnesyltransferase